MRFICLAIAWALLLTFTGSVLAADITFYFEAESANELTNEMEVLDDDENAWGEYVAVPNEGQGDQGAWAGVAYARYEIVLPVAAKLYIWGRVRSFDDATNAFFFKLNDHTNLTEFIWDVPDELEDAGPAEFCLEWCWDLISARPGKIPFEFDFKAGKNDLYIIAREADTGLDALYLVPDPDMEPPDAPVDPGIQAVEPSSKLAESWGRIKKEAMVK